MRGRPSPNPFVGALIVYDGKVVGEGYHKAAGLHHAEVEAILDVKRRYGPKQAAYLLARSTLYVNLEPCNHHGKQPPCTKAIIKAKIPQVVFAMKDPNPNVRGGGEAALRQAGVEVRSDVLQEEARAINAPFLHHLKTGRALITLKMAMSKDGRVASDSKRNRFISSPASRKLVQSMRSRCPAIMVGIGTVKADNPRLTCRERGGHDPLRVIIDQHLEIDEKARVLADKNVWLVCAKRGLGKIRDEKKARLLAKGYTIIPAPVRPDGLLDLDPLLVQLAKHGIDHILLEGGPGLAQDMIEHKLVDGIVLFKSPKRVGEVPLNLGMAKAIQTIQRAAKAGNVCSFKPEKGPDHIEISEVAGKMQTRINHTARHRPRHSFWTIFFRA